MLKTCCLNAEKSFSIYRGHAQNAELSWGGQNGEVMLKTHKLYIYAQNVETQSLCKKAETLCLNAETIQAACGSSCAKINAEQLCSNTQLTAVPEGWNE